MKTALLFLCLLLATARAAIISGTIPEANRLFLMGQRPFDFDGDGYTDLTFAGSDPGAGFLRIIPGYAGFSTPATCFITTRDSFPSALAVLAYGTQISSASDLLGCSRGSPYFRIGSIYNWNTGTWIPGPWSGQSGYLGFDFITPPAGPGDDYSSHYGRFRMAEANGVLELFEWAYETQDNTAIIAGHVPEPSACLLLALPFVAFMRRRSRIREWGVEKCSKLS